MKYPKEQFEVLLSVLKVLAIHFELDSVHPSNLHRIVFTEFSQGHQHNQLYVNEKGDIAKKWKTEDEALPGEWKRLINPDPYNFELYPGDCTDSHIETAIKKAIKQIGAP